MQVQCLFYKSQLEQAGVCKNQEAMYTNMWKHVSSIFLSASCTDILARKLELSPVLNWQTMQKSWLQMTVKLIEKKQETLIFFFKVCNRHEH